MRKKFEIHPRNYGFDGFNCEFMELLEQSRIWTEIIESICF